MAKTNEIDAFLEEIAEEQRENSNTRFINRERLDCPIDEDTGYSDIYTGYILEGYTPGIEGDFGESTAVRVVEPGGGRRLTLWLTGFEQEHFKNAVVTWTENGASFPMEVKFLRHKVPSRKRPGRFYNRWSGQLLDSGEDVVVPPVPEDQYETPTEEAPPTDE